MKRKSAMTKQKAKKLSDEKKKFKDIMKEVEPFLPEKSHILKRQPGEWDVDMSSLGSVRVQRVYDAGDKNL